MSTELEQEIETKVIMMLSSVCKTRPENVRLEASLVDELGVDSIRFLELMAEVEERFAIQLEVEDLQPELFQSVSSMVHFIQQRTARL